MRLPIVELNRQGKIRELREYISSSFEVTARSPTEDDFAVDTIFRKKSLFSTKNKN